MTKSECDKEQDRIMEKYHHKHVFSAHKLGELDDCPADFIKQGQLMYVNNVLQSDLIIEGKAEWRIHIEFTTDFGFVEITIPFRYEFDSLVTLAPGYVEELSHLNLI